MKRVLLSSLLAAVLAAVLAAGSAWVARGIYDGIQMDEGVFHVVNADAVQRTIELTFPSGERRSALFAAGQAVDFRVANTGEGAVSVMADGESVHAVGYVTSYNSLAVIVVQSDRVLFSQYLRGRKYVP